ncbi:MAG: hypothetical protein Q7T11_03470 [Deltaproteobacteria bacterium]|nr:hypothetical protein [Deltaproteobacteria bacterium]
MDSRFNFSLGNAVKADSKEEEKFKDMKPIEESATLVPGISQFTARVQFGKDATEDIIHVVAAKWRGDFPAYVQAVILSGATKDPSTVEKVEADQLKITGGPGTHVEEVRYGDIDGDADLDIAVKLSDGAIYVFHQLPKAGKKLPPRQ